MYNEEYTLYVYTVFIQRILFLYAPPTRKSRFEVSDVSPPPVSRIFEWLFFNQSKNDLLFLTVTRIFEWLFFNQSKMIFFF